MIFSAVAESRISPFGRGSEHLKTGLVQIGCQAYQGLRVWHPLEKDEKGLVRHASRQATAKRPMTPTAAKPR